MNEIRTERGDRGGFQRSAVAVTSIGLMKHAQGLHHFARKKFPPAGKEQRRVFRLIGDLRDRAAPRPDIAVMPVEEEDLPKSKVDNVAQYIRKVHGHNFGTNRHGSAKMRRMCGTLRELNCGKQQAASPRS